LPLLQVFHWPSQSSFPYLFSSLWWILSCFSSLSIYVVGFQMRALRKSSGKVEIKMQHGRCLTGNAARYWNPLMVSSLSPILSLSHHMFTVS
jgi:hypothetical protein